MKPESPAVSGDEAEHLARRIGQYLADLDLRVLDLLGLEVIEVAPGRAVLSMTVREDMTNSHEVCHGGLIFALADTAFAYAFSSGNQAAVTLSGHVNFHSAARLGDRLTATATVPEEGGRTSSGSVVVTAADDRRVASFQGLCYRVRRPVLDEAADDTDLG